MLLVPAEGTAAGTPAAAAPPAAAAASRLTRGRASQQHTEGEHHHVSPSAPRPPAGSRSLTGNNCLHVLRLC